MAAFKVNDYVLYEGHVCQVAAIDSLGAYLCAIDFGTYVEVEPCDFGRMSLF